MFPVVVILRNVTLLIIEGGGLRLATLRGPKIPQPIPIAAICARAETPAVRAGLFPTQLLRRSVEAARGAFDHGFLIRDRDFQSDLL